LNNVENIPYDIDELIGKVLAGEATEAEHNYLLQWRMDSPDNETYYKNVQEIFTTASATEVQIQFDSDAAWNKVKAKLHSGEGKVTPLYPPKSIFSPLRIAAGLILLLGVTMLLYKLSEPTTQIYSLSAELIVAQDTLPDGSTAYLNKRSALQFEYNPREKVRRVTLKGEAYFAVKHEDEKPFVIEAEDVLVRDIGTEFNLKAYPEQDTIEIIVTEGEVQFYTHDNPGLTLRAGEKAIYSKRTKEFYRIEKPDTNALAYKTKVFSFNNTDLRSVVNLLNEVYNSKIILGNEAIQHCRLTANFKEDNPEIIAEVIAETMGLTLTKQNDTLILNGQGCIQ
jgi:transmembrane sensor